MSSEIKNKLFSSQLNTHNSQLSLFVVSIKTWRFYMKVVSSRAWALYGPARFFSLGNAKH